jgi:hypothetical protein
MRNGLLHSHRRTNRDRHSHFESQLSDMERRLSALEQSHRSVCKSHDELEEMHESLRSSFEGILISTLRVIDNFVVCITSRESL